MLAIIKGLYQFFLVSPNGLNHQTVFIEFLKDFVLNILRLHIIKVQIEFQSKI